MPLAACSFGSITPSPEMTKRWGDDYYLESYRWLERRLGYWPLFLSVGDNPQALGMTGYQNQWARLLSISKHGNTYREPGQFPSTVLFSFSHLENPVFTDYDWWHEPLNDPRLEDPSTETRVMSPQRSRELWLRKARERPGTVQAHVRSLDLRRADRIWCRSQQARRHLRNLGFPAERVEVHRLPVGPMFGF